MTNASQTCSDFGGRTADGTPCRRPAAAGRDGVEAGRCADHVDGRHANCSTRVRDTLECTSEEEGPVIVRVLECHDHGKDVFQIDVPEARFRTEVDELHLTEEDGVKALVWSLEGHQYRTCDISPDDFDRVNSYMNEYRENMSSGCLVLIAGVLGFGMLQI